MIPILEELWFGNIHPQEQFKSESPQTTELLKLIFQNRDKLTEAFTPQQKELLQKYDDCVNELSAITECAIFADRIAIDEELVRLRSHFGGFDAMLDSDEPVGRRLDFQVQETNREINTIGSKSANAAITARVVDVKCELEKIREQIQNIE